MADDQASDQTSDQASDQAMDQAIRTAIISKRSGHSKRVGQRIDEELRVVRIEVKDE